MDKVSVVVGGDGKSFRQQIEARQHHLSADEPVAVGGEDTGPVPFELLLSSLGACTSITVTMYAKRKGWPLEGIRVELTHEQVRGEGRADRITRTLHLTGPLDEEQRARLLDIANKCPVHKALSAGVDVATALGAAAT
jgi:putative redox protein